MKKLILPAIFVFIVIQILTFLLVSPTFAFFHDKNSTSDRQFDCSATLTEADPVSTWNSLGKVVVDKGSLGRKDNDYCLLKHQSFVSDYGGGLGQVEDPAVWWTIKITYFKKAISSDEAFMRIDKLKKSEKANLKITYSEIFSYSGKTSDLSGSNYLRNVVLQENCLIEQTVESNLAPLIKGNGVYHWNLNDIESFMGVTGGSADGLQYKLLRNQNFSNFCSGKDFIPAKELKPSGAPASSSKDKEKDRSQEATREEENLFKKALGGFPVFIGEWFSAVSTGIKGAAFMESFKTMGEAILNDPEIAKWEEEQRQKDRKRFESFMKARGFASEEQIDAVINRMPKLGEISDYQTGQWQQDSPFRLDILNGQAQIKYPGSNEWQEIKIGDRIPPGSTIFTGMDATTVLSIKDKGIVEILPFTEITINEQGLEQAAKEGKTSTNIYLRKGEIEVNVDPSSLSPATGVPGWGMSVYGPYYSAAVRGTHFWVKQEEGKQFAIIGVYKGEVEVKSTGSDKSVMISPNGDPSTSSGQVKPGVVVVASKLSVTKLAIAGAVLVVVLGGLILTFRKRFLSKVLNKKKK